MPEPKQTIEPTPNFKNNNKQTKTRKNQNEVQKSAASLIQTDRV